MNIVLIDDEAKVLMGIHYIFEKYLPQHRVVAELKNPSLIFDVLKNNEVNLVFTDVKMPGLTGIELTQKICSLYPELYVVILSAYSDFDSVRLCMKNGAFDYLLKPISYEAIIEITQRIEPLISSACLARRRQENSIMLKNILYDERAALPVWCAAPEAQLFVFYADTFSVSDQSLLAALAELFAGRCPDISYPLREEKYLLLLCPHRLSEPETLLLLSDCVRYLHSKGNGVCCTCLPFSSSPGCLARAFARCRAMTDFYVFNDLSPIVRSEEYDKLREKISTVPVADYFSSKKIIKLISGNKLDELKNYLEQGSRGMAGCGLYFDPQSIRFEICEELFAISAEFHDVLFDMSHLTNRDYISHLMDCKNLRSLLENTLQYIIDFAQKIIETDRPGFLYKVIDYINQNYMYDITLKDAAEVVHLNPWYLSSQFKLLMRISFSEYMTKTRIEASKKLLQQNDLKIYEVAEMVGFQEPTYFNTVFKKHVGTSPKNYQRQFNWKE